MFVRNLLLTATATFALIAAGIPANAADAAQPISQITGATTMTDAKSAMLKVPGASIYYEVRGSGPLLLMIGGGPQDAGVFADLARQLAGQYTVVTYDPRGNSRSAFDGAVEELELDVQADDAAALIDTLGGAPAYVFGTSGGAQIGLDLAARHPDRVRALVAHEPPTMMLMADPSAAVAETEALYETYLTQGAEAAMAKFFSDNGLAADDGGDAPQFEMPPEAVETFARVSGNFEYWLAHGMRPLSFYKPDVDALKKGKARIVVAIGEESAGQPIEAMSMALAEKLGTQPVRFPGDHMGFGMHAEAFATKLHTVLRSQ